MVDILQTYSFTFSGMKFVHFNKIFSEVCFFRVQLTVSHQLVQVMAELPTRHYLHQ